MTLLIILSLAIIFIAVIAAIVTSSHKNQDQTEEKPEGPKKYFLRNCVFNKSEYNILRLTPGAQLLNS